MSDSSDTKVQELIDQLFSASREDCAAEIQALQSIYGDSSIRLHEASGVNGTQSFAGPEASSSSTIRYDVSVSLNSPFEDVSFTFCVSLPPSYPLSRAAPQLQLLSRYIGPFGVDSELFGTVTRTFISTNPSRGGLPLWNPPDTDQEGNQGVGEIVIFDGIESARTTITRWYEEKTNQALASESARGGEFTRSRVGNQDDKLVAVEGLVPPTGSIGVPDGMEIIEGTPIHDRGSTFVARVCHITHPSQVEQVIKHLLDNKHIRRAAHPTINAWRCTVDGTMHSDNDDDGETAAGSRLAHLLQIIELDHVLVVVTRYFGGTHLGPDRFKHINQCARDALELGGFLEEKLSPTRRNGRKGHNKK